MRYVVKKLRKSDLTFFAHHFRQFNSSKQKALNLSRRVFIDVLFPTAPGIADRNGSGGVPAPFHLPLAIYGPGERREPQIVSRSVLPKARRQKNWRLNGEFIRDPDDDPTRYHNLRPDDVAVLAFDGDAFPTAVTMVLLSQSEQADLALRVGVLEAIADKAMGVITRERLAGIIGRSAPATHPIRELLDGDLDAVLEDAALGSAAGTDRLRESRSVRRMSAQALQDARRNAEIIGRNGEVLLNEWLGIRVGTGELGSANWSAEINAISPWDFEVRENDGETVRIELKSTTGPFERNFHISHAEVEWAAKAGAPRTDLYRVYDLTEGTASLRILRDIRGLAGPILAAVAGLDTGILPDSYTISPGQVGPWSEVIAIEVPDSDDEDDEEDA